MQLCKGHCPCSTFHMHGKYLNKGTFCMDGYAWERNGSTLFFNMHFARYTNCKGPSKEGREKLWHGGR